MKSKKDYRSTSFKEVGKYGVSNLRPKGLPFAKLYFSRNVALKYVLAALIGVLFAILSLFLLKNTGGFSYGLGALLQGLARFISFFVYRSGNVSKDICALIYSILFWGLLLIVNIPLFIFSWKKIGHRFTLLSLTFIVVDVACGIALDQIPGISNIYIFGDTSLYTTVGYNPSWIRTLEGLGIQIVPFWVPKDLVATYHPSNYIKPFLLILSGAVYAVAASVAFSLLYVIGGCTTGADFVSTYLAVKKHKDIAGLFFVINLLCIFVGVVIGCFIPAAIASKDCARYEFFFSANFISVLVSLAIFTIMFKAFYPRNRKYKVEVFTKKSNELRKYLYKNAYVHASSMDKVVGGFSKKQQNWFMTMCSTMELPMLLDQINKVDSNSMVSVTRIEYLKGPFATQQLGSDGEKAKWKK